MKQILLVGIGGGAGTVLRFLTVRFTERFFAGSFPLATFLINITGCLLIGILIGLFAGNDSQNHNIRLLLVVGFCGGYTTFSAFSYETIQLLNGNNWLMAMLYITSSVIAGICAVWLGLKICA